MLRPRLWRPTPHGGWRQFATELVVVVLGILIALGAQQAVDSWNWRGEIAAFRAAFKSEMGFNLNSMRARSEKNPCINARLDQLEKWHSLLAAGTPARLTSRIGRPTSTNMRRSVWESRTPDTASHLDLRDRLSFATLSDVVGTYQENLRAERQIWNELLDFEGASELDRRDLTRLRGLIERARLYSRLLEGNLGFFEDKAKPLALRAWADPDSEQPETVCAPLAWEIP